MNVIVSAIALVIGILFMTISTIAGIIFMPIVLLWYALFGNPVRGKDYPSMMPLDIDPIEYQAQFYQPTQLLVVPSEYYNDYSAYLKSDAWRSFRKLVLKRDKYRCVDCGIKAYHKTYCTYGERLQVHHLHYDGIETMTFSIDQCVSVCKQCHDKRHGR